MVAERIAVLLAAVLTIAGAADAYLILDGQESLSEVIATAAHRWPIIPLLVGVLIGHLFFTLRIK